MNCVSVQVPKTVKIAWREDSDALCHNDCKKTGERTKVCVNFEKELKWSRKYCGYWRCADCIRAVKDHIVRSFLG